MCLKRELPIVSNAFIMSECWNYNKFAIMQTSKSSDAWIASHFGIYIDETYNAFLGHNGQIWFFNDFAGILEFNDIEYWETPPNTIIDVIKKCINDDLYTIVYLMTDVHSHKVHEYLFYGYDDKHLCTLSLMNGKFRPVKVEYTWVFNAYKNYYDYHLYNPDNIAWFSANFFPITVVKVNDRMNLSVCFQEAIRRFEEEINGKKLKNDSDHYLYTGIECLNAMISTTNNILKDKNYIDGKVFDDVSQRYRFSFCKIYEHMTLVYNSMLWMLKIMHDHSTHKSILDYKSCVEKVQQLAMASIKFNITKDWELIEAIEKNFEKLYSKTKDSLHSFLDTIVSLKRTENQRKFMHLIEGDPNILIERKFFI